MIILRKGTHLQQIPTIKHLLQESKGSQAHIRSHKPSYSKIGSGIQMPGSNPFLKITERTQNTQILALATNRSQTEDIENEITKNKLTLNLVHKTNHSFNQLPSIASFDKIKKMLVPSTLYERYSQLNKIKGEPESLLERLEREIDVKAAKIKLQKSSKRLVRCSRFILQEPEKIIHSRLVAQRSPLKQRSSCQNCPKSENISHKKNHSSMFGLNQRGGDWKLKDFYQHIENQGEKNEFRIRKLNERNEIIHKLRRINDQCKELETNSNDIMKSIDVFAKYHDNVSQKLVRKHRKIQKVENSCHY